VSIDWAKPGTKAVIDRPRSYRRGPLTASTEIVVVTRVTPAQVIVGDRRFRKSDGKQVGGDSTLKPIDMLVSARFHAAASAIRGRIEDARRGDGYRTVLVGIAEMVAAALADIDELEAPATEVA
jgi:hypothetical protein